MRHTFQILATILPIAFIALCVADVVKSDEYFSGNIINYNKECFQSAANILKPKKQPEDTESE